VGLLNKRYVKVLVLYTLSTLIPVGIINEKCINKRMFRWFLRTLMGYAIFAYGLHTLSKFKV